MRVMVLWPGHSFSTYDVARGYSNALRALGHAVDDFNYHNQLSFYLQSLEFWAESNPGFHFKQEMAFALSAEQVAPAAVDFVPDVVLVVCGLALHKRAYELLDKLCIPMAILLTESPYSDGVQARMLQQIRPHLVFTNDKASVQPLRDATRKRVEYLPHSFDPDRHYPREVDEEYRSDVFFFGTMWAERERLFGGLKRWMGQGRARWCVDIGGVAPVADETPAGLTRNEVLALRYCGTKVALNHNRTMIGCADGIEQHGAPGQAWSLGPRAFEIAGCGAFQLCDDTRPELGEVFGESVATYADAEDLKRKVVYYLTHDEEREEMAAEAHQRVQACSFERRAEEILLPAIEEVL